MSQYFTEVSSYLAAIGETDIINGNHLARGIYLKQQLSMHTDFYSDFLAFPHALISLITNSC